MEWDVELTLLCRKTRVKEFLKKKSTYTERIILLNRRLWARDVRRNLDTRFVGASGMILNRVALHTQKKGGDQSLNKS